MVAPTERTIGLTDEDGASNTYSILATQSESPRSPSYSEPSMSFGSGGSMTRTRQLLLLRRGLRGGEHIRSGATAGYRQGERDHESGERAERPGPGRSAGADSVAIHYGLAGSGWRSRQRHPAVAMGEALIELPLLGLLPDRTYKFEVVAYRGSVERRSPSTTFTTGSSRLTCRATARKGAPRPRVTFSLRRANTFAIDNTGRVVRYRRLSGPSLNFMAQPNGRLVVKPSTPDPTDLEPSGRIRSARAPDPKSPLRGRPGLPATRHDRAPGWILVALCDCARISGPRRG